MATQTRTCANCKTLLSRNCFSKRQWSTMKDLAKCITCIENNKPTPATRTTTNLVPPSGSTLSSPPSSLSVQSGMLVSGAKSISASVTGSASSVMARRESAPIKGGGDGGARARGGSVTISSGESIAQSKSVRLECDDDGVREMKSFGRQRCPLMKGAGKVIGDSVILKELDITLSLSREGKNSGVEELFQGLSRNRSIELLQLRLDSCQPEPDIFQALIPFFDHNNKLSCLELCDTRLSWALNSVSVALSACTNSQLQSIKIKLHNSEAPADDEAIVRFFVALSNVHSLSRLCLEGTHLGMMEVEGLSNLLMHSASNIQRLEISGAQLDDERVVCLGNALAINKTVKYLNLDMIDDSISVEGWQGLAQVLRNPDSALETLIFRDGSSDEGVCNEGVAAIVRALEGNSPLKSLDIGDDCGFVLIEEWVWELFDRVLCDKTSIAGTYSSNHTLEEVIIYDYFRDFRDDFDDDAYSEVQDNVRDSLHVNGKKDKSEVARQKILERHFAGGKTDNVQFARGSTDIVQVFASMPDSVLVHAAEWIGRDNLGYSVMYDFVRGFPQLFDPETAPRAAADRKRKR